VTLIVVCKTCGRELRSNDRWAGMRVRCPQCSSINQLPSEFSEAHVAASCFLCGQSFEPDSDLVKDVNGRYYHRRCYEDASRYEQARREEIRRRQTGEIVLPAAVAVTEDLTSALSDAEELGELEPTMEDLWKDVPIPSETASAGPAWQHSPLVRRDTAWLYVMMGFAAAVPAVVLLFIMMQLIINTLEGRNRPFNTPHPKPAASVSQEVHLPTQPPFVPKAAPSEMSSPVDTPTPPKTP
jgi:phage FluMu protein Com